MLGGPLVGGPLVGGPAARADEVTPSPSPTAPALTGTTTFTLSPVENGVVDAGEALTVSVSVQNGTAATIPALSVDLGLGTTALPDRVALSAWLAGTTTSVTTQPVASATLESIPSGGEQGSGMTVPADDPLLEGLAPGVYPLVASYTSGDDADGDGLGDVVASTSVVIIPDPEATPVGISVVVPLTAGVRSEGLLSAVELAELTAPGGSLSAQVAAVAGTDAVIGIDPAIVASIRVLGDAAPASARAWLARLDDLPNERFSLQFGDADPAVQLEAGATRLLSPSSLAYAMDDADFPVVEETEDAAIGIDPSDDSAEVVPSPSPTGENPDEPVLPTTAELVAIDGARGATYWPTPGAASPEALARLGVLDAGDDRSVTILPSRATAEGASGRTIPAHAVAGDATLLVYDSIVTEALTRAASIDRTPLRGAALTEATAHLVFASAETGGRDLAVAVERGTDRSNVALHSAIIAAEQAPGTVARSLTRALSEPPRSVAIADATAGEERVATAAGFADDESELARFATILTDPALLTGPERAEILQLLSVSWAEEPVLAQAAAAVHRQGTLSTLDSVGLLPVSTFTLLGSDGGLRFWVRNELPYPVNLVLYTTPDDLRLDVQPATEVTATPQSNTRVEVPVQARVGSGEVTLDLQLRSPSSVAIGPAESVQVNVRAEWEAVGLTALGVVVGGLIVLGAARTVLKIRARRTAGATPQREPADPAEAPEVSPSGAAPAGSGDSETEAL
ncbi:hypothetical protein HQM25_17505 [Microbacterium hominis]|uniref:2-oxoglutarate dehydrogenase n=1 Tax=Microbacterium hominis TaxID=162426 RepID=A0A7D4TI78_9MICO|nr:hypothetical protein HQM25_17505 [Microbacterium hominis]